MLMIAPDYRCIAIVTSGRPTADFQKRRASMNAELLGTDDDSAMCVIATAAPEVKGATVSGSIIPPRGPRIDLRSAASGAAIELDNISLKKKFKTAAIHQLIGILSSDIPAGEQSSSPMSLITPTVIVMDRVVRSKKPGAQLKDVIRDLESSVSSLQRVASDPEQTQQNEPQLIESLRSFCLDISRYAASLRRPPLTSPRNNSRN
jgi:hypothetical protein